MFSQEKPALLVYLVDPSPKLPIWFQAIKGVSAEESGIRSLPRIVGSVSSSLLSGLFVSRTGYVFPVLILGSVIASIGCGALASINPSSGPGSWIGFQAMVGFGIGLGMQQGCVVVQNGLDQGDIPSAISIVMFFQALGASLLVSITQSVFTECVYIDLKQYVPSLTRKFVADAGATTLVEQAPASMTAVFIGSVNKALTQSWFVTTAATSISAFCAIALGFKKLKR